MAHQDTAHIHALDHDAGVMRPLQLVKNGDDSYSLAVLPASFEPLTIAEAGSHTASHYSAAYSSYGASGLLILISITAASGTGGVRAILQGIDPITDEPFNLYPDAAAPAVTSTGMAGFLIHPNPGSAGGHITMAYQRPLPPIWRVHFTHGDGTPYTYRATALLLP